jgi:hypothetical protein
MPRTGSEVVQPAKPFEVLDRRVAAGRSHHLFG